VDIPDAQPCEVLSVHPMSLYRRELAGAWRAGLAQLPPAQLDGSLRILLGDFNATLDHALLRALLRTGYRDAAAVTGRGLVPTWPYVGYPRLPRITLDHVLADRRIRIRAAAVHPVPGSDHRAVCADLLIPAGPPRT
jgi:endonuclease/exonuclease/phosphatase family metal-dependent hydrolase